jgi:hypothetical protein
MDATAYMSVSVLKSMRLPLTSSDGFSHSPDRRDYLTRHNAVLHQDGLDGRSATYCTATVLLSLGNTLRPERFPLRIIRMSDSIQ